MRRDYTTYEVARLIGVFPTTVINWVNKGKLPAYRTPGGHRRVQRADLIAFIRSYRMPMPPELDAEGLQVERKRVLVIDDEPGVAAGMAKLFGKYPAYFDPRAISDPVEALVEIGQWRPDLVVLDVVMPIMDGLRVCASLKADAATRHIRVIAITGKRLSDSQRQFLEKHADAYLAKPLDYPKLVQQAQQLLGLPSLAEARQLARTG